MQLTDNTILITGGTSGIGRALAEALHARGNQVIIAGRRQELLDEVTAANPGMRGLAVDMQDSSALEKFAAQVRDEFPKLNVLVNNAGITKTEDFTAADADPSGWRAILETNVASVLHLTALLLPALRQHERATIITTTSGLAFVPTSRYPTYCASKAFLHSWLQSLRHQLRETSVEVLELAPPYVQTELGGKAQASDPHAMPLAEYTAEVMQLLGDSNPPDGEILVQRVQGMRYAERSGEYAKWYDRMN